MLEGYIDYIINLQQQRMVRQLDDQRSLQLQGMTTPL